MGDNQKLLTIIVPVYKVKDYLRKCVDSILAQTYKNFELILIDDGSPDECGVICDSYKNKDERVKVIHKTNGGLSSARNAGLEIANGDYIGFVDSDDWIEPNMYSEMIQYLEQNNCTMVECAINLANDTTIKMIQTKDNEIISGREALKRHLDEFNHYSIPRPAVWSKLYKKDFWKTNRFPEGKIHEDYLLTCMALYESNKFGIINKGLYNHLVSNPTSIINSKFSSRDLYKKDQCEFRIEYLTKQRDEELIKMAKVSYYCYLMSAIWKCDQNGMKEKKELIQLLQSKKEDIDKLLFPKKRNVDLVLIFNCPQLFLFYRRTVSLILKIKKIISIVR